MVADAVVALMSIRPRFAQAILDGKKLVELRRIALKRPITHVAIYETGPTSAIVGVFEVRNMVEQTPRFVWNTYNGKSSLSKQEFCQYYSGATTAIAIEIGKVARLVRPVFLSDLSIRRPPQSFMYLPSAQANFLLSAVPGMGVSNRSIYSK